MPLKSRDMPSLKGLIRTVCLHKALGPPFPQIHFANKDNSSYIWGENLITASTLTLFAVMNRASHICGFWFIFLTFCMQRRRVLYNHNVTRQKKRSGLWENKPPLLLSSSVKHLSFCFAVAPFQYLKFTLPPTKSSCLHARKPTIFDVSVKHRNWVENK